MGDKPNICKNCIHRNTRKNTTHISCKHPSIEMSGVKTAARYLEIEAVLFGILSGWFTWPYDFDETWLTKCVGVEKDETEKTTEL